MNSVAKTDKTKQLQIPPLLNPPLVEAIFELRWELQGDPASGRLRDPSYPMMYGRLYERIKKDFPIMEDLPSTQVHPEASPFVVRHRLRKERAGWPLVQIGPGIVTINTAKGYSWDAFKALIEKITDLIIELSPDEAPMNFVKSEIRYINAISFDPQKESSFAFLRDALHTQINLDPEIFSANDVEEKMSALSLNFAFPLSRPVGNLLLSVNLGQADNKPAYIVQSVVQSLGETVPQDGSGFSKWLEKGHTVAVNCFHSFCKGSLMMRFATL